VTQPYPAHVFRRMTRKLVRLTLIKDHQRLLREALSAVDGYKYNDSDMNYPAAVNVAAHAISDAANDCRRIQLAHQHTLEPLVLMPPPRKAKRAVAKPMTTVERRAIAAKASLSAWQRKQKLAATKVKKYRVKVGYYKKKGVV
jgi:hypothetical protein